MDNSLAADRWYFPPLVPPAGDYWLTVYCHADGRRFVVREPCGPDGWPGWAQLSHRFTVLAFMRADAPTPYLY